MKKYKLFSILIIVLVVLFALSMVGCDKNNTGKLKTSSIGIDKIEVSYSYNVETSGVILECSPGDYYLPVFDSSNSGVWKLDNLKPDTTYTIKILSNKVILATATAKTESK